MRLPLRTIAFAFVLAALASPARAEVSPEALVQSLIHEVTSAVRADKALAAGDKEKSLKLAEDKILPHIDFEEATRLAASRAWSQASAEQRRKLVAEFRSMIVRTYANAIGAYGGQEPKALASRSKPAAGEATVRYQFARAGGQPVLITYELHRTGQGWKIYDINVEGMSLVLAYRTEFDAIVKQEGIDGLIRRLAQKNAPAKIAL